MPEEKKQPPENIYSQQETIALLQQTIGQLQGIVQTLETDSPSKPLPKRVLETLVTDTSELALMVEKTRLDTPTPSISQEKKEGEKAIASQTTNISVTKTEMELPTSQKKPSPTKSEEVTIATSPSLFTTIRSLLPKSWHNFLSDGIIIGMIAGLTIVIVSISSLVLLSSPQPPSDSEIVQAPIEEIETREVETPSELTAPELPETIEITPAPVPQPQLTPEQNLLGAIATQLGKITDNYADGLILTLKPNFVSSRLLVTVSDEWYQLNEKKQEQLANQILQRSQQLDFRKLELIDTQGILLARNPVVGKDMVIFQR